MPKTTIDFTDAWLDFRFSELRASVSLFERLLEDRAVDFDARVAAKAAQFPAEQRTQFYARLGEEHRKLNESIPNLLRRALFLVCYAEIESYLNSLCRASQRKHALTRWVDDLQGRGIEGAKEYIQRIAKEPFPSDSREWHELTEYRKLRNVLAHTEARLSEPQRSAHIGGYVKNHPHLDLDHQGGILIRRGFCEEVIETAVRFLKQLPRDLRMRTPAWD
jgi:hypothetical protein